VECVFLSFFLSQFGHPFVKKKLSSRFSERIGISAHVLWRLSRIRDKIDVVRMVHIGVRLSERKRCRIFCEAALRGGVGGVMPSKKKNRTLGSARNACLFPGIVVSRP